MASSESNTPADNPLVAMKALGVILARAGSKGLPGKCVYPLLDRALIEYTIDHALASETLERVVLSTDSCDAKQFALQRGIEVVDRPSDLASDTARVDLAVHHAVRRIDQQDGILRSAIVILYGNIPVRAVGVIDRAVRHLWTTGADSVRTVASVGRHHPDWMFRLEHDRMVQYRPNSIHRRQELEPLYYHDGAVVVVTRNSLFAAQGSDDPHAFLGRDRRAILQPADASVDIDEPLDVCVAEAILKYQVSPQLRSTQFTTVPA